MQGHCTLCDNWRWDLMSCRICGDRVGSCCYSFGRACCLACKAEFDEDPE